MSHEKQPKKPRASLALHSVKSFAQKLSLLKLKAPQTLSHQDESLRQAAIIQSIEELVDDCLKNHRN